MSDTVLTAPISIRTIAGTAGLVAMLAGGIWTGATLIQELRGDARDLRKDLSAAIVADAESRRQISERSQDMDRRQQLQIDQLRADQASQAAVLAEVRATMNGMRSALDRIETRLFDPALPGLRGTTR
jgi:hypothetical protein